MRAGPRARSRVEMCKGLGADGGVPPMRHKQQPLIRLLVCLRSPDAASPLDVVSMDGSPPSPPPTQPNPMPIAVWRRAH